MSKYKITPSGRLFEASGVEIPRSDVDPAFQAYVAWLAAGGTPEQVEEPAGDLVLLAQEIESAQEWGQAIVRAFESAALASGTNSDPFAALALDRYLREVSDSLKAGRLHVGYAALHELLKVAETSRPAGAEDSQLVPIFNALASRLGLPSWGA